MVGFPSNQSWKILAGVISPMVLITTGLPPQLPAQASPEFLISLEFPPSGNSNPTSTAGGGVRGNGAGLCIAENEALTALGPKDGLLTTVAETPTLFFYVPNMVGMTDQIVEAEFVLTDKLGKDLAGTPLKIELPGEAGIIKLPLPETVQLESDQEYTWQFAIICDPADRGSDAWVQGKMKRTELNSTLSSELEEAAPLQQAELYAQARIWNETLAIAADLREDNQGPWEQLLQSVGLEKLAEAPFVEIMTDDSESDLER